MHEARPMGRFKDSGFRPGFWKSPRKARKCAGIWRTNACAMRKFFLIGRDARIYQFRLRPAMISVASLFL